MWSIVNYVIILRGVVGNGRGRRRRGGGGLTWPLVLRIFGMVSITFFFAPPSVYIYIHVFDQMRSTVIAQQCLCIFYNICMNIILHACIVLDNKIAGKDDWMQVEEMRISCMHVHACMTMNEQCYFAQGWHFHCSLSLLFVLNREGTAQQAI